MSLELNTNISEILSHVIQTNNESRSGLGIPTQEEIEEEIDPRIVSIMGVPWLTPEELDEKTKGKKVILFVSYATGTLSDELIPVLEKRMAEGVPVIIISDNAGDEYGITEVKYDAGSRVYTSGAIGLQTVNVSHHKKVKQALLEALNQGKKGQEIVDFMKEKFFFPEGKKSSPAEGDTEAGVAKVRELTREALKRVGVRGDELDAEMDDWEFGDGTGWRKGSIQEEE